MLIAGGGPVPCAVIEALYEKRTPFDGGSGRPVRFWVEKKTSLIRQATYERKCRNGELAQWTARVETITLDQAPPQWAVEKAAFVKGREEPKWVGQPAREFSVKTLDGRTVSLAALRGRVVLLNFWGRGAARVARRCRYLRNCETR